MAVPADNVVTFENRAMNQKLEASRWDVQFFLKTPTQFPLLSGDNLRLSMITKSPWAWIIELQDKLPAVKRFLQNAKNQYVLVCSIRTTAPTTHKAIFRTHRIVESYLDSIAVAGFCIPAVCSVIVVREGSAPDAEVMEFHRDKWLEGRPSTEAVRESWTARSDSIMQHLLPVLSQLIEKSPDDHNELAWRALHSAKLFRRGIESASFGMEFLCKFAALENLVMGGKSTDKRATFCSRLGVLVRNTLPKSESLVAELWNRRHPLVHEARIEFMDEDPKAFPVHVHMETLNWLFQVTFVFLSDCFESVTSLNKLWELADRYQIPDKIRNIRPQAIGRFPASTWAEKTGIVWNGIGKLIDDLWAAQPTKP